MAEQGAARRQRVPQVERREAQRPGGRPRKPAAWGARAPGQVSQTCLVSARGLPDRKGGPKGAVAQRPGASRRSIPLVGIRKKGLSSRRRGTTAYPAPPRIRRWRMSAWEFGPAIATVHRTTEQPFA